MGAPALPWTVHGQTATQAHESIDTLADEPNCWANTGSTRKSAAPSTSPSEAADSNGASVHATVITSRSAAWASKPTAVLKIWQLRRGTNFTITVVAVQPRAEEFARGMERAAPPRYGVIGGSSRY